MGLRRLAATADVDLELDHRIDFSTLRNARHFAKEEMAARGGEPEVTTIVTGRHTVEPESDEEERREYRSVLIITRDRTRPRAAADLYLYAERCIPLSGEKIESRWDEFPAMKVEDDDCPF
jgi:hypothetical protein